MSATALTRGARGGGLTLSGNIAIMVIQFLSVVVLSRMLEPSDFGLVAMANVFIALGNLFRDFGMPMAALQSKDLTRQQASNLFWTNALFAFAAALILTLSTPLLIELYEEPRLGGVIPALALAILIGGIGAQIQVDLARAMRYSVIVGTDVASQIFGFLLAVSFASQGFGYWALIAQVLGVASALLLSRWILSGWKPLLFRRGHGAGKLIRSGGQYGLAHLLSFMQGNIDALVIGVRLGPTDLGYYNRGYQLLTGPAGRILDPLTQVVIPTLNHAQKDGRRYEPILLRIQFLVGLAIVWLFAISAGTAPELVPLALGPGWESVVNVFRILALGGSIWVFNHVSYWAFLLNEKSDELLKYNLVSKPLAVTCIVAGSFFGVEGVAWGYALAMGISWPLNLIWLARKVSLPSLEFAKNGTLILAAGGVAGFAADRAMNLLGGAPPILAILVSAVVSSSAMVAVLLALPRTRHLFVSSLLALRSAFKPNMKDS